MRWLRRHPRARVLSIAFASMAVGGGLGQLANALPFPWGVVLILAMCLLGFGFAFAALHMARKRLAALHVIALAIAHQDENLLEAGTLELAYLASPSRRWPRWLSPSSRRSAPSK
jgi:hypothetical protein